MDLARRYHVKLPATRARLVGREAIWVGAGQSTAALSSVLGVALLTGYLAPRQYGEIALALTVGTLAQQFLVGPLSGAVLRYYSIATAARKRPALVQASAAALGVILLGLGVVSIALGLAAYGGFIRLPVGVIVATYIFAAASSTASVLDAIQIGARRREVVAFHDAFGAISRYAAAVILLVAGSRTAVTAIAGFAVGALMEVASQLIFFRQDWRRFDHEDDVAIASDVAASRTNLIVYAWPFATWGLFTWARLSSDRWALATFSGAADVGLYAVVSQFGYYPLLLGSAAAVQLLSPILFGRAGSADDPVVVGRALAFHRKMCASALAASVVAFVAAASVGQDLLRWMTDARYDPAARLLPVMVLAGGLYSSGLVAGLAPMAVLESNRLALPNIATSVLGVLVTIISAKAFGIDGVVAASLVYSMVYCFWLMALAAKIRRERSCHS